MLSTYLTAATLLKEDLQEVVPGIDTCPVRCPWEAITSTLTVFDRTLTGLRAQLEGQVHRKAVHLQPTRRYISEFIRPSRLGVVGYNLVFLFLLGFVSSGKLDGEVPGTEMRGVCFERKARRRSSRH
jgi:hypothetical protein